jgi:molybdate transport repressor ModE-like protein
MAVSTRPVLLTPTDLSLLALLGRSSTLVDACRQLGVTRDVGTYRIRRLRRLAGGPVVRTQRGGAGHGATRLTPRGARLLGRGRSLLAVDARPNADRPSGSPTRLRGRWHAAPQPNVTADGLRLFVGFRAQEGEPVEVERDPESVILATRRFPSSARNVLAGVVRAVHRRGPGTGPVSVRARVTVGRRPFDVALTERSVRELGIARGRPVFLYVKATALRRRPEPAPTRGSRRS